MIKIQNTLVSEELFVKEFICNLNSCKGMCCVDGDSGAPVDEKELDEMKEAYKHVKNVMPKEKVDIIDDNVVVKDYDNELTTPLVYGKECVYTYQDEKGIYKCYFEKEFRKGKTKWRKPISCYLYPIRVSKVGELLALNYSAWHICSSACELGKEMGMPVFKFLEEPLKEFFGAEWYTELEIAYQIYIKTIRD